MATMAYAVVWAVLKFLNKFRAGDVSDVFQVYNLLLLLYIYIYGFFIMLYVLGLIELNLAQPSILILTFLFCRLHVESSGSPAGNQPLPHQRKGLHVDSMWSPLKLYGGG